MSDEDKRACSSDEIKRLLEGEAQDVMRGFMPGDEPGEAAARPVASEGGAGEAAGTYGYGHRAHQPDPAAHYGFSPQPQRLLPSSRPARPAPKIIWKRPLR